jgi:hypothetical protein
LTAEPPGVELLMVDLPVGRTPLEVSVATDEEYVFTFRAPRAGDADARCVLTRSFDPIWIPLDLLAGGLIGPVVDAVTNGWSSLHDFSCAVRLDARGAR